MSRFSIADLEEYEADSVLDSGQYTVEVGSKTAIKEKDNGKHSLQVELRILEGPTQKNGKEPEGNSSFTFFSLDGYEDMKDGGDFAKGLFNSFMRATGVDFDPSDFGDEIVDDLIGVQLLAVNRVGPDQNGDPQERWGKWKPAN